MGQKGAKLTKAATVASEALVADLASLGSISARKMFGGYGVFEDGKMFALISSEGRIYFKVSEENQGRFDDAGSERFGRMPYSSVPDHILRDQAKLLDWAATSVKVAHDAKA